MENRLQNPLNPLGVDLVEYIWIGKLGFETPTVFGWGKGPGLIRVHTSCKIFASGHKSVPILFGLPLYKSIIIRSCLWNNVCKSQFQP